MRLMAGDWCEGNNGPKAESGPGPGFVKRPADLVQCVIATIAATGTVSTAVASQKRENKRCENGLDNRETLCMNGFVIQRKNEKNPSDSHVITTKLGPGLQGSALLVRAHVDLIVGEVTQHTHVRKHAGFCLT